MFSAGEPGEFRELYPSAAFDTGDPTEWFWARANGSIILASATRAQVKSSHFLAADQRVIIVLGMHANSFT